MNSVVDQLYDFGLKVQEANKNLSRRNALKLSRAITYSDKHNASLLILEMISKSKLSIPDPVAQIFLQVLKEDTELDTLIPFAMGCIGEQRL